MSELRTRLEVHEEWSPGAQAIFEQEHARAVDALRGSRAFMLTYLTADGKVGCVVAALAYGKEIDKLCGMAELSLAQYREDTAA